MFPILQSGYAPEQSSLIAALSGWLGGLPAKRPEIARLPDSALCAELIAPEPGYMQQAAPEADEPGSCPIDPGQAAMLTFKLTVAHEILCRVMAWKMQGSPVFSCPHDVRQWLVTYCANLGHEVFVVLYLDARHKLIMYEELFRGTVNQTSVYPREIVRSALACNSSGVLIAHNHPSCCCEPSVSDERITGDIQAALATVDIKLLDHFVVAGTEVVSFAERGMIV